MPKTTYTVTFSTSTEVEAWDEVEAESIAEEDVFGPSGRSGILEEQFSVEVQETVRKMEED